MMFYPTRVSPGLWAKTSTTLLAFILSVMYISGQMVEPLPLKEEPGPQTISLEYTAEPVDDTQSIPATRFLENDKSPFYFVGL